MKNLFIPYHLALRLKDLGFDEPCLAGYNFKDRRTGNLTYPSAKNPNTTSDARVYHKDKKIIGAPTYQQVSDWLNKNYYANVTDFTISGSHYGFRYGRGTSVGGYEVDFDSNSKYETWDKAIDKTLNLIPK